MKNLLFFSLCAFLFIHVLCIADCLTTQCDEHRRLVSYEVKGSQVSRVTFSYDEQGRISTVSESSGKSMKFTYQKQGATTWCILRTYVNGVLQKRIHLGISHDGHMRFLAYDGVDSADAPLLDGKWFTFTPQTVTVGCCKNGKKTLHRNPHSKLLPKSLAMTPEKLVSLQSMLRGIFSQCHEKGRDLFLFTKKGMQWFFDERAQFEEVAFAIVDQKFWTFLGYNPDPVCEGKWEAKEPAPNIRITHINGILGKRDKIHGYAEMISKAHGNVAVYYIYLATEGFSTDVMRALFAKMGVISPQAHLLAKLWKRLIHDMGGVAASSKVIHYAHSLGGAESANALKLLSPEERSHIQMITIGSPSLLTDENAMNYVAFRDAVPLFDPVGYLQALFGIRENVIFIGSRNGFPLVDHFLAGETYQQLIEDLGRKFREGHPE